MKITSDSDNDSQDGMGFSGIKSMVSDIGESKPVDRNIPMSTIRREMEHYGRRAFEGKVVFCECKNSTSLNFWNFFAERFEEYGLRKLITIRYMPEGLKSYALKKDASGENRVHLSGNGDIRECMAYLREADIVTANPPWMIFAKFLALLIAEEKNFVVIGNLNAIAFEEIFHLIRDNLVWIEACRRIDKFMALVDTDNTGGEKIEKRILSQMCWFTNLPHRVRAEGIHPIQSFDPRYFLRYDNFDAIEVSRVLNIPRDWPGLMSVPISYLFKHCPDRFEIIGLSKLMPETSNLTLNNRRIFMRLVMRNRHPEMAAD